MYIETDDNTKVTIAQQINGGYLLIVARSEDQCEAVWLTEEQAQSIADFINYINHKEILDEAIKHFNPVKEDPNNITYEDGLELVEPDE